MDDFPGPFYWNCISTAEGPGLHQMRLLYPVEVIKQFLGGTLFSRKSNGSFTDLAAYLQF